MWIIIIIFFLFSMYRNDIEEFYILNDLDDVDLGL